MKYLATFSGGKDSLDTIIWCKNNLQDHEWDVVFCDTDWEDVFTYLHIAEIESQIGKKIIRLKHSPFDISDNERIAVRKIFGSDNIFAEMVIWKSRFPSTKARFCTEELKTKPMIDYLITLDYDVTVLQGVRSDESQARRNLKENDDYFKFYFEPYKRNKKGDNLYHNYRKKDVIARSEKYATDVLRPILNKSAIQVFDSIYSNGFKPNPLYKHGMSRVGCFPCVMCQKGEIKAVSKLRPKRLEQLEQLEQLANSTFFSPGYIPLRFCTKKANVRLFVNDLIDIKKPNLYNTSLYKSIMESDKIDKLIDEDGDVYVIKQMKVPQIKDVVKYVNDNPDQAMLFEPIEGCVSVYNICEL